MLRHYKIVDNRLVECEAENGQVVHYVSPDESQRKHLVEDLKLDEHTLNSSMDPDEVARLEFEPEHAAMIFKRPKNYSSDDAFMFRVASTGMFLFKDRLVIVTAEDVPLFEGRQFMKVQSVRDLALRLIYRSIFHFIEHLKVINMVSSSLEQQINTSMENKHLLNMFTLEKSLVYYINAIHSNGGLIEKLRASGGKIGLQPENLEFLDDILIENSQCARMAEIYSSVLAGMMDARASVVANNLNLLIKTLTLITIAIMLPTLVVSIFSMNVGIPMARHPFAFWIILGMGTLSGAFVFFWVWYKRI